MSPVSVEQQPVVDSSKELKDTNEVNETNVKNLEKVDSTKLGGTLENNKTLEVKKPDTKDAFGFDNPNIKINNEQKDVTSKVDAVSSLSEGARTWVQSQTDLINYIKGPGTPQNGIAYITTLGSRNGSDLTKYFLSIDAQQMSSIVDDYNLNIRIKNGNSSKMINKDSFMSNFNTYKPTQNVITTETLTQDLNFSGVRESHEVGKLLELPDEEKQKIVSSLEDISQNKDFKLTKVVLRGEADNTGIKDPEGISLIKNQLDKHIQLLSKNEAMTKKLPVSSYDNINQVHPDWSKQDQAKYAFSLTRALMQISYLPQAELDKIANVLEISTKVNPEKGNQYTGGSINFEGVGSEIKVNSLPRSVDKLIPMHKSVEFNVRLGNKPSTEGILGKYFFRKELTQNKNGEPQKDPTTGQTADNYVMKESNFYSKTPDANSQYLLEAGMKDIHVKYDRGGTVAVYDVVIPDNYQKLGISQQQVDAIKQGTASFDELSTVYGLVGQQHYGSSDVFVASKDLLTNYKKSMEKNQ